MEIVIGGIAAACAGFFTNPLEVVKTRLQLQGELRKEGEHAVHYKNLVHATYIIAKNEGILALQKGLIPALWVQFIMNGFRFGFYHYAETEGIMHDDEGNLILYKNVIITGTGGVIGHYLANPFFIVKTQLQSQAEKSIAVGYQHKNQGLFEALKYILRSYGVKGLYRGGVAAIPRASVASVSQLTTFTYSKIFLSRFESLQDRTLLISFLSSCIGGTAISVMVTPFDLILTRVYNQPLDDLGRGKYYKNYFDCVSKIYKTEGLSAFYKGVGPMYFRLGPHSILSLMFWDKFREWYDFF